MVCVRSLVVYVKRPVGGDQWLSWFVLTRTLARVLQAFTEVCVLISLFPLPLQVELHVHLDGAIRPETILYYGR